MTFYTIGYEGLSIDKFFSCLHINNIKILADVRESPVSRKPGFSLKKLQEKSASVGISYVHFQELGCPPEIRDRYKSGHHTFQQVQK